MMRNHPTTMLPSLLFLAGMAGLLGACNTIAGLGEDASAAGKAVANVFHPSQPSEAAPSGTSAPPAPPSHAAGRLAPAYFVYFRPNQTAVDPEGQQLIGQIAGEARQHPRTTYMVIGMTDRVGDESYNLNLSDRRAAAVRSALINAGVPATQIQARGTGESNLPIPTANGVADPRNRVVQIIPHPG